MADTGEHAAHPVKAANTFDVLSAEYRRIWPERPAPVDLDDYYRLVQEAGQAGLCLSGGGIRSASFALGVLQALSRKKLLTGFHYLSTVSGGGYIGGWLQRWIHEREGDAEAVMRRLGAGGLGAALGSAADESADKAIEPRQIRALRENSNFLTPRVGIRSNDTWTAISISVRNIAVNWLLFAPLLLLVTMVPNIYASILEWVGSQSTQSDELVYIPLGLGLLCAAIAAWNTCRALPSYRGIAFEVAGPGDRWLNKHIVRWMVGWALFGTLALWADVRRALVEPEAGAPVAKGAFVFEGLPSWLASGFGFALLSLAVTLAALILRGLTLSRGKENEDYRRAFRSDLGVWFVALVVAALTIPIGCAIFASLPDSMTKDWAVRWFATLAPLWLMGSQLMIAFIFAAFRRHSGGTVNADADREWLARLSAVKLKQMFAWAALAFTTLLLLHMLQLESSPGNLSLTGLVALISGITAVFGGRGENTGNTTSRTAARILRVLPTHTVIAIATFIFAMALLTIFGALEQAMVAAIANRVEPMWTMLANSLNWLLGVSIDPKWLYPEVAGHLLIGLVLLIALWLLNRRIPVNRFSLNALYRNRLARAFLGGARTVRAPDPFTGFDPKDNIELHRLNPEAATGETGPGAVTRRSVLYPIVNVALNVTASKNLAWQERKAQPFILSPLYCGSATLIPEEDLAASPNTPSNKVGGAYIDASCYGGSEPGMTQADRGISLATAVAISGAAATPNMGYHSSPATAFLMTLFNVRLGQWMPNPARAKTLGDKVLQSNPSSSFRALLSELFGQTDDQGLDIYLSDGGHFENLALYEMVRRRCKFIVVSDAGADPNCDFEDLGNAIRKVKIDLGVDIRFTQMRISSRGKPIEKQFAWALGNIDYGDGHDGQILYVKPSFFGRDLPVDVVSYAAASAAFPHESTADQFFSESQFESYRKLGFTFVDEIGGRGQPYEEGVEAFFKALNPDTSEQDEADKKLKGRFADWLRGLGG